MKYTKYFLMAVIALIMVASAFALTKTIVANEIDMIQINEKVVNQKLITTPDGEEILIDFDKSTVKSMDVETPIVVDELYNPSGEEGALMGVDSFVHIPYNDSNDTITLDVYIETTFYNNNQVALDDFWDKFYPRFEILKEMTGWSSKKWFGVPLEIYVYGHTAACYGGNASPTHSNVVFSDPMYKVGCNKPYYENGTSYYNNTGELGDWWPYMNTALHEALHSISPYPIYTRSWLTEGWSEYYMYNVLTQTVPGNSIPDINQETADTYLHNGFAGYQWDPYVANDFHDTTTYNRELQRSHGYDITGHLFSKLRDEENMDWDRFYELMNNNKDTLDSTFSLGPPYIYYTDAFVINVFGKAMGHTDYWTQTDPMWNYYSTPGHGYGARNILSPYSNFEYFADYQSALTLSSYDVEDGDSVTVIATIYNQGDTNTKNIIVRLYDDSTLLHEEALDLNKFQNKQVITTFTPTVGVHNIEVRVDEDDVKIEFNESNNDASKTLTVNYGPTAPELEPIGDRTVSELGTVTITPTATDVNEDTLTFTINNTLFNWNEVEGRFEWKTSVSSSSEFDVEIGVTDGMFWDYETVHITVLNTCVHFDKDRWCWDCLCQIYKDSELGINLY